MTYVKKGVIYDESIHASQVDEAREAGMLRDEGWNSCFDGPLATKKLYRMICFVREILNHKASDMLFEMSTF